MTAVHKPESLAVQMTEVAAIGTLPLEVQHQLELRKLSNQVAGKLAELNWGKQLDHATRRAVADWGNRFDVDTTTEINVLGGNVYVNAAYYLRRLGNLISDGLVEYAYADHIEDDPRLKQLGPEGEGEYSRRLQQRLMHGIKGDPASAVVFRIKLRSLDREITGAKWCGNGTRKGDPVGDSFPVESSESRAARRAMRLIVSHVPKKMAAEIDAIETSAEHLSARIASAKHQFREESAALEVKSSPMALPAPGDPYGPVATVEKPEMETATVARNEPAVPAPQERKLSRNEQVKMPFTMGDATVGTPLGLCTSAELDKARNWAMENGKFPEFVEAAGIVLDDRSNESQELGL